MEMAPHFFPDVYLERGDNHSTPTMLPISSSQAVKSEPYLSGTQWWAPRRGRPAARGSDRCAPGQWHPGGLTGAASTHPGVNSIHSTHLPPAPPTTSNSTKDRQQNSCVFKNWQINPQQTDSNKQHATQSSMLACDA